MALSLLLALARVKSSLCVAIADDDNELDALCHENRFMAQLYEELVDIEARLKNLNTKIRQLCRQTMRTASEY